MITTLELLDKVRKFKSIVLRFEYMPRHRTWIAIHAHGFQSEVTSETVVWWNEMFATPILPLK